MANWALRTSPKFNTGVKYEFHQGFGPDRRSGDPNHLSHPCNPIIYHIGPISVQEKFKLHRGVKGFPILCVYVCVYVCVCVLMPTHCTITFFGFRAMRIDGVSVVYFRFTHLLVRPCNMGDEYSICICVLKEMKLGSLYV